MDKKMNFVTKDNRNKPAQPLGISVDGLFGYAQYSKPVFDELLRILVDSFTTSQNRKCKLILPPLKTKERVLEKLEDDDIEGKPSNILDVVRATVSLPSVEDLLEFINYSINFNFKKSDFKNMQNKNVYSLMQSVPSANVFVTNAFLLDIDDDIKEKYPFLKKTPEIKKSNYMDFKFYTYIPIPKLSDTVKNEEYMLCEVIATLDDFTKVYNRTHAILEGFRTFEHTDNDDVSEDIFSKAMIHILKRIHVDDVIEKYNKKHPNGIKILPYADDKEVSVNFLNSVSPSQTITDALCGVRKLRNGKTER